MTTKMFGNFWTNVVLVVNFWSFRDVHASERASRGVTTETYAKQLKDSDVYESILVTTVRVKIRLQ